MCKITISEEQLSNIINTYCSCGGRGPDDDPCPACSIWHDLMRFIKTTAIKKRPQK